MSIKEKSKELKEFQDDLKKSQEDYFKGSSVKENIVLLASGKTPFQENPLKSLTVRLAVPDYAKLSVLATRLNQSPSGLAKMLLVDALSDGLRAYLSVKSVQDEFAGESLAEDIRELEQSIFEESL